MNKSRRLTYECNREECVHKCKLYIFTKEKSITQDLLPCPIFAGNLCLKLKNWRVIKEKKGGGDCREVKQKSGKGGM